MFSLSEQVEECVVAPAVGLGRSVGSVWMNGVSFFFCRFRELEVRDGETSPLFFLANQMIILKGIFLLLLSVSL